MGVVCTNTNKKNKQRRGPKECDSDKSNNKLEKINREKIQNETINNMNNNATKNPSKIFNLKEYKFYFETSDKNDFFIVSNFDGLKFSATSERLFKKWEEILLFTRKQKKFSYRNLNKNHNFIISNTNQRKTSNISGKEINIISSNYNHKDENFNKNNNSSNNNNLNLNNADDKNNFLNFNYNKDNLVNITLGRGSLIENYKSRNADCSNLIQKFQIAFFFNKYRYIKYLSKGPPNNLRWTIWVALALCQSNHDFVSEPKYIELIQKEDKNFIAFEEEQIKKDLNRSNENKEFFCNKSSLDSLYNILKALAIEDPELGYCQGMNILAANFLLISDGNEYETFNMLRFIFKHMELREFFLNGFPKLIMYLFILKEFIRENLPKLFAKISELEIPEETWIFKWLQTLYNLTLPLSISIRLIDCLLCFGLEFLLNFSLAFIKCFEKKLLLCEDINDFLLTFKIDDLINPNILVINMVSGSGSVNKNETGGTNDDKTHDVKNDKKNMKDITFKPDSHMIDLNKGNDIPNNSPNKIANLKKAKKEENSCFYFKSPKKDNKEYASNNSKTNININICNKNNIKSDSNTNGGSDKNENLNSNNYINENFEDKKSSISTTNNINNANNPTNLNQIKYKINSKDELLSFREKLITNAKKIDLKEAIKQMIDNYTKENMESKNKFNDNESSTGDGLNESKSRVYDNENIKNINKNNNNEILNESHLHTPFKISYKHSEKDEDDLAQKNDMLNKIEASDAPSIRKYRMKSREEDIIDELISEEKESEKDFNPYFKEESAKTLMIADKFNSTSKQATKEKSVISSFEKEIPETPKFEVNNNINNSSYKKVLSLKNFPASCKNIYYSKKRENVSYYGNSCSEHQDPYFFKYNRNNINNESDPNGNVNNNNDNNNPGYRYKNFFSINFNSNNQTSDFFHRFSLHSSKEHHSSTPRGLSIAQISLMNNIQEKLEVIRKIDGFEKEENENDDSCLDINSNIDENFVSDVEWENRSKINRNINVARSANIRRMSDCFSPDRLNQKKLENEFKFGEKNFNDRNILITEGRNILNSIGNQSLEHLQIENELNLDDKSFGGSLYENYSDCEFFEIGNGNKEENWNIKINKTNPNTHFKSKVIKGFSINKSGKNNKINHTEENSNKCINLNSFLKSNSVQNKNNTEKKYSLNELALENKINKINSNELDEFNKSMDMQRKAMKSFVNNSNEKKAILNNLGVEINDSGKKLNKDLNEKRNFLHIKLDGSNKSLMKVNISGDANIVNRNKL